MPTYLDLVYDGGYVGLADFGSAVEIWNFKGHTYLALVSGIDEYII